MRFREKLARFMYGRYGMDQYGKFLLWGSLILMLLSSFFSRLFIKLIGFNILYILALAGLVYCYFRAFSRNIYKRGYENEKYLKRKNSFLGWFNRIFKKDSSARYGNYSSHFNSYSGNTYTQEYKIFKCPSCKQKLRVPRGKGRIQITCKKCGNMFIKRS